MSAWLSLPRIFLIDAMGAFLSAVVAGLLLPNFYDWTALPVGISYVLAGLALGYAVYSLVCFFVRPRALALLIIIFANLFYALLLGLILLFLSLKIWGYIFLGAEIAVILGLVVLEFRVYRKNAFF